jgi:hypothetical protein
LKKKIFQDKKVIATLKFQGSLHGWTASDFHRKADNLGATLTLLKIIDGPCIGGFTNASWTSPRFPVCVYDNTAIIFNLTNF